MMVSRKSYGYFRFSYHWSFVGWEIILGAALIPPTNNHRNDRFVILRFVSPLQP